MALSLLEELEQLRAIVEELTDLHSTLEWHSNHNDNSRKCFLPGEGSRLLKRNGVVRITVEQRHR